MNGACGAWCRTSLVIGLGTALTLALALPAAAQVTKSEAKCASKLGKGGAKLAKTVIKGHAKCRNGDISGKSVGSCPDAKTAAKIAKASSKLVKGAKKSCISSCSVSNEVSCISDALCPPMAHLSVPTSELCSGYQGSNPFDIGNIGFPGAYCENALGGAMTSAADAGDCVTLLSTSASLAAVDAVYGDLRAMDSIHGAAVKCLSGIGKGFGKIVGTVQKGVGKCRDSINKGKIILNPSACLSSDAKLLAKVAKMETKLASSINSKCTDADILELDLCGQGAGGVADRAAATSCLLEAAREIAASSDNPGLRSYGSVSLIDAAYPPEAICGDNVVNQAMTAHLLLGEECDGSDDSACPGACFPPGDLWECSCSTIARVRTFKDQSTADSDAGWTGLGQDASIADKAGLILAVSDCDCDQLDGFTCTGNTSDSVCDLVGYQTPHCSWDPMGTTTCDSRGNGNLVNEDGDCRICDVFSVNAGDYCGDEGDCSAQCYASDGSVVGAGCQRQADCAAGSVCRGQCDRSGDCLEASDGGPQPVSQASSAVCAVQRYRGNTTGTVDIVTGSFRQWNDLFSSIHLGYSTTVPCPMCGGFCVGGTMVGEACKGTCSSGGEACRYDSDCSTGESCTAASRECPGGSCNLSNVCRWGPSEGETCKAQYEDQYFGSMSGDCKADVNKNITGLGMVFERWQTSDAISWKAELPCSAAGYELFDCHCPYGGGVGQPTQPNSCGGACDAGAEFGQGCADANGFGALTVCAAGANVDRACDEDSDCPGSSCSSNPTHCTGTGDPGTERLPCSSDADCGLGSCVDACPAGRCLPLCVATAGDPDEGYCAAGPPVYHCSGGKFAGRGCIPVGDECNAVCSDTGVACASHYDCAAGASCVGDCDRLKGCEAGFDGVMGTGDDSIGAGRCMAYERECMMDPITAEGGTTLNGLGDSTNFYEVAVSCLPATGNVGVNSGSGMGGPLRNRSRGVRVPNFTELP